ncbi:caspase recruitment domain-containing protein 19 isoform X7 [Harpia harpyja]|uniref:caspase recruitment domain-containing protein 19 isoform X7 n=1 Tax=Harpia harpyja TaxID=202280 RepID=UPI0022B0D48D|nr:caspase recruitment domain-containing protein 19 isoform X7 [Harpia harpyja]
MPEPGVRPVLGRHSLAVARGAKSIVSFSSPAFWLRWEEDIATPEISERLMPHNTVHQRAGFRWQQKALDQSYCHRLQHDMYFLTSNSRLNEQVVDKIILQLNRVYPQILSNAEAEKFRNPKASLHTRLSDLIKHLQKKGDRHCQEFYRALQINADELYNDLPSRKILSPVFFLACFSVAAGFALFWYCCNSGGNSRLWHLNYGGSKGFE